MPSRLLEAASLGGLAATAQCGTSATPSSAAAEVDRNKTIVRQSFERWREGTGSPFELLAPDATWTMVGSSPLSRTYRRQDFLDEVIAPFNARMKSRLIPTVRGIYADGDTVITRFDASAVAEDGQPYVNSYSWYFVMRAGWVTEAVAFFDTRPFDDLWMRVTR